MASVATAPDIAPAPVAVAGGTQAAAATTSSAALTRALWIAVGILVLAVIYLILR
jgi:hypothetical protein